jgi:hypothetical protein
MKVNLHLALNEETVKKAKLYAAARGTSVSQIVEGYLDKLTIDSKAPVKNFVEKYAGILSGNFSDKEVKKIKKEHLEKKYRF